jgi:hypothetical protein
MHKGMSKQSQAHVCLLIHITYHLRRSDKFPEEFLARIRRLYVTHLLFTWLVIEMKNAKQYDKDLYEF